MKKIPNRGGMIRRLAGWCAVVLVLLVSSGCMTRDARIQQNFALFCTYPPATQQKIRSGQVDMGFTREMVYMALGPADRIAARQTVGAASEVWIYTTQNYRQNMQPVRNTHWYQTRDGKWRMVEDWDWVDAGWYEERDRMRVEFYGNQVGALEVAE
jgi:hypothetical protein